MEAAAPVGVDGPILELLAGTEEEETERDDPGLRRGFRGDEAEGAGDLQP